MMNFNNISIALFLYFISFINISYLLKTKKNTKTLFIFIMGLVLVFLIEYIGLSFKIFIRLFVYFFIFYFLNKNSKIVIVSILFNEFIFMLSDMICLSIIIMFNKEIINDIVFYMSFVVSLLSFILIRINSINQLWNIIQNKIRIYFNLLVFLFIVTLYFSLSKYYNYFNLSIIILLIIILIYILIINIIKSYQLEMKIKEMLDYIDIYEEQIDELRINQHEYRNILSCIKIMVSKNKKAINFIDGILNDEIKQDYDILKEVQKVKISALKGLFYYKLCLCKEKEINFTFNISNNISYKLVSMIDNNTIKDLVIILGSLIDNAVEACMETDEKSLSIYIYKLDSKIVFQISNTFKGIINLDLLYKTKYSTKGNKRGYGLSLVNKKVKENNNIELENKIHNDVFVQYLKVIIK